MTIAVSSVFEERAFRRPMAADVRRRLDADIRIVFRMLNRSEWVREFILGSNVSSDLLMLMSPLGAQSSFILETEEHQEGRLTGSIKMRYLVVPSFTTPEGLSGGAIVTTYARRDHPLHAPSVMATTRVGRYVRDNDTGEWLFLTRNETDNVTRMQWLHTSKSTTRERICLTCDSTLFNKGLFAESILFECHDEEWRPCPQCHAPPEACCSCSKSESALVVPKHPLDLPSVAAAALSEPKSEWFGRVQVSVLSNLTKELPGDVDACMSLRTSFAASQDAALALQMQNLALAERAKSVIPNHVSPPKLLTNSHSHPTGTAAAFGVSCNGFPNVMQSSEENPSVLHGPVLTAPDSEFMRSSSGVFSNFMTEIMSARDEKHFAMDETVSEPTSRVEKRGNRDAPAQVQTNDATCFAAYPQQLGCNPTAFDPMSLLMVKHSAAAGNGIGVMPSGNVTQRLETAPAAHSALNIHHHQNQGKQQLSGNHDHQSMLMNDLSHATQIDESSNSSNSTRGQEEDDDDDDDGGLFDTNMECQRMSTSKAFDTLLGNFMAPHASPAVPSSAVDNLELVDNPWLNVGPSPGISVQKATGALSPHHAREHAVAQSVPNGAVTSPTHRANPFPPHHAEPNGVQPHTPPLVVKQPHQVSATGAPPKREHKTFVHGLSAVNGIMEENLCGDPAEADDNGQPLARLQPRPPGMASSMEGAWMWQMGPRGPFGMAAIAAARERERRAEERRRKNREAAARSNARAKERLERIKVELEMNKDRISRLSRKRRELEVQNSTLRQRLGQQAS